MPNATTRIVRRADVALSCCDEGVGPPVVFLASWSLPGASWRRQVDALSAAGLRCITYDRRGHGHTPDPGHGYDFDTLADDLAAVLDAFDLHDVTLVTFSAGSGEAVRYLTRHGRARIARLAMVAPTTPLLVRRDDHPDGVDPAMFDAFIETELRPDWRGWLDRNARPFGGPDVAQSELDEVITQALQASPHALEAFYRELTTADMRAELAALRLPVLVIQGDLDLSSPPHLTGRPTASLVPGARLITYEGAPHGLPVSHPARLNADLLAFIGGADHQRPSHRPDPRKHAMDQMIFVNLPVTSVERSKGFYAAVGATNNPQFSDASTAMMSFSPAVNVMVMTHERFATFTTREIIDAHRQAQVLLALSRESRAAVDRIVEQAVGAGGTADPCPKQEFGEAMYGRSFADPDGHIWEVMWMDVAAMTAAMATEAR